MHVTLDQARALDAFATHGSLQGAAASLGRVHTAVLYALKQLETQTGLELFDRSGYRTTLTSNGTEVLRHARALLDAERAFLSACTELSSGWEPVLHVVVDAIFPVNSVLEVARRLREKGAPTRLTLTVDSLGAVEQRFEAEQAQVMVTILPPAAADVTVHTLPKLKARLVAHRRHSLAKLERVTTADLSNEVLVTVRGSDPRLQLATRGLDAHSTVQLADFHSKKAAILAGLGVGWLPEWLIEPELKQRTLVALPLEAGATHAFSPVLATRPRLGPAATELVRALTRKTRS